MVKLIELPDDETIETVLRRSERETELLSQGTDLDADIMLSLTTKNEKHPLFYIQEVHAVLRGLKVYVTLAGRQIEYVRQSGIYVPEDQTIAKVQLFTPAQLKDAGMNPNIMVRREDEELGKVYATYDAVTAALNAVSSIIDKLENQEVDVKRFAPEATTAKKGKATVSVEDFGTYLRRFEHHALTPLNDNYITSRKHEMTDSNLTFLPGNTPISWFQNSTGSFS